MTTTGVGGDCGSVNGTDFSTLGDRFFNLSCCRNCEKDSNEFKKKISISNKLKSFGLKNHLGVQMPKDWRRSSRRAVDRVVTGATIHRRIVIVIQR